MTARVIFVGISETTGVPKKAVPEGLLRENYGLEGDAHASEKWHRQVSLLATASIDKMKALGLKVGPGDFAENLTCEGIELHSLPIGARLHIGSTVILEVSQIGKECHTGCAIMQQAGKCIMPKEGVFAKVIAGGKVQPGDSIQLEEAAAELSTGIKVEHYDNGRIEDSSDTVVIEIPLTIVLNGNEIVTMLCSPAARRELAAGYLQSEGLINKAADIKSIEASGNTISVVADNVPWDMDLSRRSIYSSGGKGISPQTASLDATSPVTATGMKISATAILKAMTDFQKSALTFQHTGGTHSAALWDGRKILYFSEDIGRHNAIDKIFGKCLLENIDLEGKSLISSGRVSSEILLKIARRGIRVLISKSAPTDAGVRLAREAGITLVGFARGNRFNIYSGSERIEYDQ